jgi:hypothetical protein
MSDDESIAGKGSTERATGAGMTASPFTNVLSVNEPNKKVTILCKYDKNTIYKCQSIQIWLEISYQRCYNQVERMAGALVAELGNTNSILKLN